MPFNVENAMGSLAATGEGWSTLALRLSQLDLDV
jgi:hypothetical protein